MESFVHRWPRSQLAGDKSASYKSGTNGCIWSQGAPYGQTLVDSFFPGLLNIHFVWRETKGQSFLDRFKKCFRDLVRSPTRSQTNFAKFIQVQASILHPNHTRHIPRRRHRPCPLPLQRPSPPSRPCPSRTTPLPPGRPPRTGPP